MATTSYDGTVRLWDVSDRERPWQLGQPLPDHTGRVAAVTFAHEGRTLVTASSDQTVILWDVSDRDRALPLGQPLTGHDGAVHTMALSSDGHTLATAGDDETARLWELPRPGRFPGGEVREACLRAGGPLDEATWDQYASGVSYRNTCADAE
ncbi:MAG: WD40 repeat domain-containing protein [Pseudonocardiaceae bacterium]